MSRRLRVLLSAYACEPGKGSEPGVGWNFARVLARDHDVWVLTRSNNRPAIEHALGQQPIPGLHFVYHDLPRWARWWKRGQRGVQLYYYLWQRSAAGVARRLHARVGFDVAQHVTFVKYWAPSALSKLPVPFLWGPVAGGEAAPKPFWRGFSPKARAYEHARAWAQRLAQADPAVRTTARRCDLALAATPDTAERLRQLRAPAVRVLPAIGLSQEEMQYLECAPQRPQEAVRFISIGRLLHWKGFHLGLEAFGRLRNTDAEYWIIGEGPELARLRGVAQTGGVADRVRFLGKLSRAETLQRLAASSVLVHPSLHESGGFVCIEGMAAGKPLICLDIGGPAVIASDESAFRISAIDPEQVVSDTAQAMQRLIDDPRLIGTMGLAGRRRVRDHFTWERKRQVLNGLMHELAVR